MQIWQPANDRDEKNVAKDDDSREVKSALADVISQITKPRVVNCSILGQVIAVVSKTAKASKGLKKKWRYKKDVLSPLRRLRSKFGPSANRGIGQIVAQGRFKFVFRKS